jgi:hypothetical protein
VKIFTSGQKFFVTRQALLTASNVASNALTMILFRQRDLLRQKDIPFSYKKNPSSYDEANKILSQLSGVPVKVCLSSARKDYSEMCHIKDTHNRNSRTVEELDEDADCNSSVCKYTLCYFLWCCSLTEGQGDCLLRFLDHTQTQAHSVGFLRTSEQLCIHLTHNKHK